MKTYYYLLLLLSITFCQTKAQNWQAISPQHVYNYSVNADINSFYNTKINTIVNIFVDSIISSTPNITQYALNTVFDRHLSEGNSYQVIHQPQFLQKEMWVIGDTFFFQNPAPYMMIRSLATIGQSWIFDPSQNITANVVDVQSSTTFGQADSIKIMALSTNDTIILSQNFGILRFPFTYNSPYYYQLVGIDDLHLGTTGPKFEDIFDFEIGDKFEYKIDQHYPQSTTTTTEKYEIMTKAYINDTFYYQVEGLGTSTNFNPTGIFINFYALSKILKYTDTDYPKLNVYNYENFLYAYSNPITFFALTTLEDTLFLGYPTIFRSPQRYSYNCNSTVSSPDSLCDATSLIFFEHVRSFTVAKGLGFKYQGQYDDWGGAYTSYSEELVAFQKNGITYGTFTPDSLLIASIDSSTNPPLFQIFPNPTTNTSTLQFEKEDSYQIDIYNLVGEKMTSFTILPSKQTIIETQKYPLGIYFIHVINSKGQREIQKLVKN